MNYTKSKFSVGGYSKEYSDNYDKVFGKDNAEPAVPRTGKGNPEKPANQKPQEKP